MDPFSANIHAWYTTNKRDLPWRKTSDPYKIWLSEIILQQTRVDQGIRYYHKFTERFPTINHLAEAAEDEVLKLWQGLGYYSRARNLHFSARHIVENHGGRFPDTYEKISALKGIGPYTAAAIASIAFRLPFPAVDGNVYRVLSRYFGISASPQTGEGKKRFAQIAAELLPETNPGIHNQALMEFGALQCVPRNPECNACPLSDSCYAFAQKKVDLFPVKTKKIKQRIRYFFYYFIENEDYTWLEKRTNSDIWKNLYQFPLMETEKELSEEETATLRPSFLNGCSSNLKSISAPRKHILSHQIIFARLIHLETEPHCSLDTSFIRVKKRNLSNFAVPRLMEKLLENTGYL